MVVNDSRRATYAKPAARSGNYSIQPAASSTPTTNVYRPSNNNTVINGRTSAPQQVDEHYN